MAEDVAIRQVGDLRSKGADIVAEAKKHPVELRRYSETVAYVVSPEQHQRSPDMVKQPLAGIHLERRHPCWRDLTHPPSSRRLAFEVLPRRAQGIGPSVWQATDVELDLPSDFSQKRLDGWVQRIRSARLRTLVSAAIARSLKHAEYEDPPSGRR